MTTQWQYRILPCPGWDEAALNRLGAEGWELVGFTKDGAAVLKRVREAAPAAPPATPVHPPTQVTRKQAGRR